MAITLRVRAKITQEIPTQENTHTYEYEMHNANANAFCWTVWCSAPYTDAVRRRYYLSVAVEWQLFGAGGGLSPQFRARRLCSALHDPLISCLSARYSGTDTAHCCARESSLLHGGYRLSGNAKCLLGFYQICSEGIESHKYECASYGRKTGVGGFRQLLPPPPSSGTQINRIPEM